MMKFALLGSGSKGNCFLFWDESVFLMIDCGLTKRYLKESFETLGVRREDLDAVLITHTHTDHVMQLGQFADLPIYAPVDPGYPYHPVKAGERFNIHHVTVLPLALSHDAPNTTGYILETWQEKLVYITDTGYLPDRYLPLIRGADYIILESNHDPEMLMETHRPQYLKMRIAGDSGHLNNEDCAQVIASSITEKTKMVVLAHISQQANTRQKALSVTREALEKNYKGQMNPDLVVASAGQHEILRGGDWKNEKTDFGTCYWTAGMEHLADLPAGKSE